MIDITYGGKYEIIQILPSQPDDCVILAAEKDAVTLKENDYDIYPVVGLALVDCKDGTQFVSPLISGTEGIGLAAILPHYAGFVTGDLDPEEAFISWLDARREELKSS